MRGARNWSNAEERRRGVSISGWDDQWPLARNPRWTSIASLSVAATPDTSSRADVLHLASKVSRPRKDFGSALTDNPAAWLPCSMDGWIVADVDPRRVGDMEHDPVRARDSLKITFRAFDAVARRGFATERALCQFSERLGAM